MSKVVVTARNHSARWDCNMMSFSLFDPKTKQATGATLTTGEFVFPAGVEVNDVLVRNDQNGTFRRPIFGPKTVTAAPQDHNRL